MDAIKAFFSIITSALLTIFNPMFNPVILLVVLFVFDILAGIIADKIINNANFSYEKFCKSIMFLFYYVLIIGILYLACYLQEDVEQGALLLKTITYVCAYFYFSNIAKNFHNSYPKNQFFAFLYFVLSLDVITKKIPILHTFLNKGKDNENIK